MIQRYHGDNVYNFSRATWYTVLEKDPQGEWVKYEDVKHLIEKTTTWSPDEEIWADAPSWAKYFSVDKDMKSYFHDQQPTLGSIRWIPTGYNSDAAYKAGPKMTPDQMGDWRKMIWRRPDE